MKTVSLFFFLFALACSDGGNSNAIPSPPSPAGEVMEDRSYSNKEMVQQKRTVEEEQEQKIIKNARLAFETPHRKKLTKKFYNSLLSMMGLSPMIIPEKVITVFLEI